MKDDKEINIDEEEAKRLFVSDLEELNNETKIESSSDDEEDYAEYHSNEQNDEDEQIGKSFQTISPTFIQNNKVKKSLLKWIIISLLSVILIVFFAKYIIKEIVIARFNHQEEVFKEEKPVDKDKPVFDTFNRSNNQPIVDKVENIIQENNEINNEIDFSLLKAQSSMGGQTSNSQSVSSEENKNNSQSLADELAVINNSELSNKNNITQNRYDNESYASVYANKIKFDPDLTLEKGSFIPCSLKTKIISTIAGEVACVITNDIYSASGNVLLIEKGSKVFGVYNSGELKVGEERIFVVWQEIRTPNGISINIASNATGELGESGIGGYVDEHFMKRFGTALLVSFISDMSSYASATMSDKIFDRKDKNNNSQIARNQSQDGIAKAKDVVNTILEKQMNIEPTLYKNQGDMVGIFVARDVDFSKVYSLRKVGFTNDHSNL